MDGAMISAGANAQRRRRLRLGTAAALVSTFVALVSHLAAGGAMPGPVGVLLPLLVATTACIRLAALRHSIVRLGLSVAVSQVAFHVLFVLGATAAPSHVVPAAAHAHHVDPATALAAAAATGTGTMHTGHDGSPMWILHAAAAIVTTLALRRAEVLIAALGALRTFVLRILAVPRLGHPRRREPAPPRGIALDLPWVPSLQDRISTSLGLRGPPRGRSRMLPAVP